MEKLQITKDIKESLAIEVVARFWQGNGNKGRITELRKQDFIDGALWMNEQHESIHSELLRQNQGMREALREIEQMYEHDLHYRDEPYGMGYYSALSEAIEIFEKRLTSLDKGKE